MVLLLLLIPIIFGLLVLLVNKFRYFLSLLAAAIIFVLSIFLTLGKINSQYMVLWISNYNINLVLSADNLSFISVLLISFFGLVVILYSKKIVNYINERVYFSLILFILGFSNLLLLSKNLIVLLISCEFLAILVYILIRFATKKDEYQLATKAIYITGFTDFCLFLGIVMLYTITGSFELKVFSLDSKKYSFVFALLTIGALGKIGSVPFHNWIPDVAEKLPGNILGYLIGALDKIIGMYLLIRIVKDIFIFTQHSVLMFVGVITILVAVFMALVQHNLKKLLSYHAISQVGYMILGISTGNIFGIFGGVFHMINNAIYKTLLFLSSDIVEQATTDTELSEPKGLINYLPITFILTLIASLSISGIPPFNGFFSKWLIYQGIIEVATKKNIVAIICIVGAMFGSALTLASFIKVLYSVFLSKSLKEVSQEIKENKFLVNLVPLLILATLCLVFGIWAYEIAIKFIVGPMLNFRLKETLGIWNSGTATLLILIGLVLGWLFYIALNIKPRNVSPYLLGEEQKIKDSYVPATDFYLSIIETYPFSIIYTFAEHKLLDFYNLAVGIINVISHIIKWLLDIEIFDIYKIGKRLVFSFGRILSKLHNGNLHFYLSWIFLGILILALIYLF